MNRSEEAVHWFVALQYRDVSAADYEEWERWIRDPDNRVCFDAIAAVWNRAGAVPPKSLPDQQTLAADTYDGSVPVAEWNSRRTLEPFMQGRRKSLLALAAVLIVTVALGWLLYPRFWSHIEMALEDDLLRRYETEVGQHRALSLPDGSEIVLGAQTSVAVTYSPRQRGVMLDRGEVLVQVEPDKKRPFIVRAGAGTITAVGTRFIVKRDPSMERVTVAVAEGIVRVQPPPVDVQHPTVVATLPAGRRVSYHERGDLSAVRAVDPASVTALREGRLQYRDESLRDVLADVNRYSKREIVFVDDADESLRYTGTVFQGDVDDWIYALPGIFDVEIVEEDAEHVRFQARPRASR